jgi:hypothetical protein
MKIKGEEKSEVRQRISHMGGHIAIKVYPCFP